MALHQTSGRTRLGIALATTTMLTWATLPVALSVLLKNLDPMTLTWFRFALSSVLLAAVLRQRRALPRLRGLGRLEWGLLIVATLGLVSNYVLFLVGLSMTTPANVQILMQLSPLMLALGGLVIFRERFARAQWIGFGVIVTGLSVFFSDQLAAFVATGRDYLLGCAVLFAASVLWASYGLAQKQLLTRFSSQGLLLCIYIGCALCLTPAAQFADLLDLSGAQFGILLYCALNTLVGYGAFAAATEHLEASRVGAIIALTPVATFAIIALTHAIDSNLLEPEHFSPTMLAGAAAVVVGSVITSRG